MSFGEYLKKLRLERMLTLRTFCTEVGVEPGNYSKMERGLLPAPKGEAKLEPYRRALSLADDSPEWRELVRLSSLSRGEIPHRVLSDKELVGKLPALFRSLEGEAVDEEVLDELVAAIRREYSA
jgi:transcriptional regulator with XRE-family HTH domain